MATEYSGPVTQMFFFYFVNLSFHHRIKKSNFLFSLEQSWHVWISILLFLSVWHWLSYLCLHILICEMGILTVYLVEYWENLSELVHEKNLEHCLFRKANTSVLMKCYDWGLRQSLNLAQRQCGPTRQSGTVEFASLPPTLI